MTRPAWRFAARAAVCLLACSGVAPAFADSTDVVRVPDGTPIRSISILTREIYDPIPPGRLAGFYRTANRLHVRTREGTVRSALLFREGEPWSAERAAESERVLRALRFLSPEAIHALAAGESTDVAVVTQDHWTTNPELNIESGGGQVYGSFSFTERNFLGRGLGFSLAFSKVPTGNSRSLSVSDPAVLGSRVRANFEASTGSGGKSNQFSLGQPFYAEDARYSYGVTWSRGSSQVQLFDRAAVAATIPRRLEETEVRFGFGEKRSQGLVRRLLYSINVTDRHLKPSVLEPGAPTDFAGGEEDLRLRRLGAEVVLWKPRFTQRRGIEQFDRAEDYDLGSTIAVMGAVSPKFLGGTTNEGFMRVRVSSGVATSRFGFGFGTARFETRVHSGPRESVARFEGRWVQQPSPDVSLITAALGVIAEDPARDFQAVIGGLNGLRAYSVHALAGSQVWRLNAETRWVAARNCWDLVSIGGAVFGDAARAWGAGSGDGPWHTDVGFGLRLSLPHSSLNEVARFDIAWPVSPTRDGRREPVLTFGSSQAF